MNLRVAVAGVTNGLGHTIVSALLDSPNLEVNLLTRISSSPTDLYHLTSHSAIAKPVNYTPIPSLESALAGLILARRFAPSEFAMSRAADARLDLYEPKRQVWAALKDSKLEYTSFQNGIFMDYFTFGTPKQHEGLLKVFLSVVNLVAAKAIVPGTGNEKVTFTTIVNIGRLLLLRFNWMGDGRIITGRKLDVEYMDVEAIKRALRASKWDLMQFFYHQVSQLLAEGLGTVTPTLNRLSPHITVTSAR
ncbi:hypothetical protein AN958_02664 [Leucoagaricus sp. SymC.cos]|nr:hypothetical protein AN958_02664 [Leucoagaricus sp. SymC.cos]